MLLKLILTHLALCFLSLPILLVHFSLEITKVLLVALLLLIDLLLQLLNLLLELILHLCELFVLFLHLLSQSLFTELLLKSRRWVLLKS